MKAVVVCRMVLLSALLLGCGTVAKQVVGGAQEAAEDTDVAAVWRGFSHAWVKKVHRVGVLGNAIDVRDTTSFPKGFSTHHWARSGSDPDSATFSTHYNMVQASNTRFVTQTVQKAIHVTEGVETSFEQEVVIERTDDNKLLDKSMFQVVINGFRMETRSAWEAKKLGLLELELSDPVISPQQVSFSLKGRMMISCKSGECTPTINRGEYLVVVYYNLIASKEGQANFVRHDTVLRDYPYDSLLAEVPESLGSLENESLVPVPDFDAYAIHVLGIRKFRFFASKDTTLLKPDPVPHLYKWKMWIEPNRNIDAPSEIKGQAFFAHSKKSFFNTGHTGRARIEIDPVTLQFKVGLTKPCTWTSTQAFSDHDGTSIEASETGRIQRRGEVECLN